MATLLIPFESRSGRNLFRCLLTILFLLVAAPRGAAADPAGGDDTMDEADSGAALRLLNREVFVFRAPLGAYQPAQRAAAAAALIEEARGQSGAERVALRRMGTNVEVRVYGRTVFYISPQDVFEIRGETFEQLIEETQRRLDQVLGEMDELRDRQGLALAAAKAVGLTAIYGAFVWALARNRRWLGQRLIRLTADKADQIKSNTLRLLGLQNAVPLLRGTVTTAFWGLVVLVSYVWLEHVLLLFPHTRPLGEQLDSRFFKLLAGFGESLVRALPNLAIVFCVLLAARFASSAVRRFFATVARGQFRSRIVDPATAPITQRLFIMLIWVTAIIVAFPYIPGSQTPAFRGISVLAGLMISLGSASVVGHLVGGLILVYNRTCRPGDYIRVGQHEGTLRSFGFFSSRMVTVKNEEVVIPNSQLSGDALINFSRLNDEAGVVLPVRISIGYNTPWRQVRDMMIEAARRTEGVRREPASEVLQTALSDFYVEYQLNAVALDPARRVPVLSDLHANLLDVFNENAVQIMSPHYRADPPQPVLAPVSRRTPAAG